MRVSVDQAGGHQAAGAVDTLVDVDVGRRGRACGTDPGDRGVGDHDGGVGQQAARAGREQPSDAIDQQAGGHGTTAVTAARSADPTSAMLV